MTPGETTFPSVAPRPPRAIVLFAMRLSLVVLLLSVACMRHAAVSRDTLRYPPPQAEEGPTTLPALDDDGRETEFEVRPDTHVTLRVDDRELEARARDVLLSEEALVLARDGDERRIDWARIGGAELSEPRAWLAFAVVVGASALAGVVFIAASMADDSETASPP